MPRKVTRRRFLGQVGTAAAAAGVALGVHRPARAGANEAVRVGLIGCGGRGTGNLLLALRAGAACVAVCDPDDQHAGATLAEVNKVQALRPDSSRHFRKLLERNDIDAVLISTPDHWHALCMIEACMAGKDVFVEKPISHNIREGSAMVRAARKFDRIVQVGTQQRSAEHFKEAKAYLDAGHLGTICLARAWVTYRDKDLGRPADGEPPAHVDYDLWLGPAPLRPFNPNRFHYQWRWFWDYAGGKQADWGIHLIDVVQWFMNVNAPRSVASTGGLRVLQDNRDTPDTQATIFDYGKFTCIWEHRQGCGRGVEEGRRHGIAFYGDKGTLVITRSGWQVYPEGEAIADPPKFDGAAEEPMFYKHGEEFLRCVKSRQRPSADIEIGHRSTTACQLGNIAYLTGRTIHWDAEQERIIDDKDAEKYLSREYRKPWILPEV